MTKSELIAKLTDEVPSLRDMKPEVLEDTINSLINHLLQLKEFENREQEEYWRGKSLEELAQEQNVAPVTRLEDILGKGADLWDDEDDFQAFLLATKGLDPEGTRE